MSLLDEEGWCAWCAFCRANAWLGVHGSVYMARHTWMESTNMARARRCCLDGCTQTLYDVAVSKVSLLGFREACVISMSNQDNDPVPTSLGIHSLTPRIENPLSFTGMRFHNPDTPGRTRPARRREYQTHHLIPIRTSPTANEPRTNNDGGGGDEGHGQVGGGIACTAAAAAAPAR
jgi:hypothetical protein